MNDGHVQDDSHAQVLATVGVTGALAFFAGGGFLVYAGNHDEQEFTKFDATERNAAGIEVQAGIALTMIGAVALAVGAHYVEVMLDRTAAH